ncbi:hypothetical protein Tco_1097927 [Tanacetum coccineum]
MASKNTSLEPPSVAVSGDTRYLTKLWVVGKGDELSQSATTEVVPGDIFRLHDERQWWFLPVFSGDMAEAGGRTRRLAEYLEPDVFS